MFPNLLRAIPIPLPVLSVRQRGMLAVSPRVALEVPVPAGSQLAHVHLCPECLQTAPSWDSLQVGVGRWARFGGRVLKLNHASDRAAPNVSLGPSANTKLVIRPSA